MPWFVKIEKGIVDKSTSDRYIPARYSLLAQKCYDSNDLDLRDRNAQTLSGPEGSSNTGCLW